MKQQNPLYQTLRIASIKQEVADFKTFTFEEGPNIQYKSGQYLTLVHFSNSEEIRRSYSIISSPALSESLSIGVKRVDNGALSRHLIDNAKPGDELLTTGAGGFFTFPADIEQYKQLFFFAAGSGITPILSLIKTALHQYSEVSIVLIYSNASPSKTAFHSDLQLLQQQFSSRFHLELLFSNSFLLSKARLHRDLILQYLTSFITVNTSKVLFYICGPESYMRLCTYTLQEQGIHSDNIKKENFFSNAAPSFKASPPDKQPHKVYITRGETHYEFTVQYPDSILATAKKQKIILPYSCENGRCGNCAVKCIKGTVWHSNNEVLTDKELQQGLILTCVGHPVNGDVELVL